MLVEPEPRLRSQPCGSPSSASCTSLTRTWGFGDVKLGIVLGLVLGWATAVAGYGMIEAALISAGAFVTSCVATLIVASRDLTPVAGTPFTPALVTVTLIATVGLGI